MDAPAPQDDFRARLTSYVNGGHLASGDLAISAVSLRLSRRRHEAAIKAGFLRTRVPASPDCEPPRDVVLPPFTDSHPAVDRLASRLRRCDHGLRAAIVHGSVATGDAVAYSDFDALVVLRDELFSERGKLASTAYHLTRARRAMLQFDPLQHHGWFVLTESDLSNYPEEVLPIASLERGKSLLREPCVLTVSRRPSKAAAGSALDTLARGLLSQCAPAFRPRDLYRAKSFLSRFMLLPALYLHARDGIGIYKGESFAAATTDFPAAEWRAMDRASELRHEWSQSLAAWRRTLLTVSLVARPIFLRQCPPPLSPALARQLDGDFYDGVSALILSMLDRVAQSPPTKETRSP